MDLKLMGYKHMVNNIVGGGTSSQSQTGGTGHQSQIGGARLAESYQLTGIGITLFFFWLKFFFNLNTPLRQNKLSIELISVYNTSCFHFNISAADFYDGQ